jgi:hypothetical protein
LNGDFRVGGLFQSRFDEVVAWPGEKLARSTSGCTNPAPAFWRTKILAGIFLQTRAWRAIGSTLSSRPAGAIPSAVFREEHKLDANDTTLVMKHYPPAHTDSDIPVHFTEADIFRAATLFRIAPTLHRLRHRRQH